MAWFGSPTMSNKTIAWPQSSYFLGFVIKKGYYNIFISIIKGSEVLLWYN